MALLAPAAMRAAAPRIGQSLPAGNEGAGTVVAAGSSAAAQALLGKTVAVAGGGMYAQYRCVNAAACLELPEGTTAAEGASAFVNPMTALGMVETMRLEGHTALVHTAAASNLGQMLNRLCLEEQVPLVNIVRKAEQEDILRSAGAAYVCNSTSPTFMTELTEAPRPRRRPWPSTPSAAASWPARSSTGMEAAASAALAATAGTGRRSHKQVYIYGGLDRGPDRADPRLRHGLGRRRLAAHPVPATDRPGEHEPPCGAGSRPG